MVYSFGEKSGERFGIVRGGGYTGRGNPSKDRYSVKGQNICRLIDITICQTTDKCHTKCNFHEQNM